MHLAADHRLGMAVHRPMDDRFDSVRVSLRRSGHADDHAIDEGRDDAIPTLKLEGKLLGPWIDELMSSLRESLKSPESRFASTCAIVTFIDAAGARVPRRT